MTGVSPPAEQPLAHQLEQLTKVRSSPFVATAMSGHREIDTLGDQAPTGLGDRSHDASPARSKQETPTPQREFDSGRTR
ncbi:MAG: hypothetical protein H0U54_19190 [Acidobacteria bacterium]|nr:hypothetical protein [Acidobacteriota bacterium]